jgi:putative SOS response-associated peptidase YedK
MKTINCRDDSLIEDRGMWTTMKRTKRCIIVAQGFYEWLKKNNGKERLPHFTKRKDGQLMCFAGLYDYVQYEGEFPVSPRTSINLAHRGGLVHGHWGSPHAHSRVLPPYSVRASHFPLWATL